MTAMPMALTRVHWHHPEWLVVGATGLGWAGLAVGAATEPAMIVGHPEAHSVAQAVVHSEVMALAMMAPLAARRVRELCVSSLWRRRYRAGSAYLVGYVACWTVVGALMMLGAQRLAELVGRVPAVVATAALAVVIASSTGHRRRLLRCHAGRPLALRGWAADRDCLLEGTALAGRCVASTWAVMLMAMVQHGLLVMIAATVYLVAERAQRLSAGGMVRWTALLGLFACGVTAMTGTMSPLP